MKFDFGDHNTIHGSLAIGDKTQANGNNSFAGGSCVSSDAENSFIWNGLGEDLSVSGEGTGRFIVNPRDGLSGIYVGNEDLPGAIRKQVLSDYTRTYVDGERADISAVHVSNEDFHRLVVDGNILSNVLYVVSSEYQCLYGERMADVAEPVLSSDAATKKYVDDAISSLSSKMELDHYWKSETSSAAELQKEFSKYQVSGDYVPSSRTVNGMPLTSDLSIDTEYSTYLKDASQIVNAQGEIFKAEGNYWIGNTQDGDMTYDNYLGYESADAMYVWESKDGQQLRYFPQNGRVTWFQEDGKTQQQYTTPGFDPTVQTIPATSSATWPVATHYGIGYSSESSDCFIRQTNVVSSDISSVSNDYQVPTAKVVWETISSMVGDINTILEGLN